MSAADGARPALRPRPEGAARRASRGGDAKRASYSWGKAAGRATDRAPAAAPAIL